MLQDARAQEVVTAYRSPWQSAHAERVIGSLRRECFDHVIVMGEMHCRRMLTAYTRYYEEVRPHQSLDGSSPTPRWVDVRATGPVAAIPELGSLHHPYRRAA